MGRIGVGEVSGRAVGVSVGTGGWGGVGFGEVSGRAVGVSVGTGGWGRSWRGV